MGLTKVTYSMIEGAAVNVLDYGADPTGTDDSLAAIQAAVDAATPYAEFATDGIMVYLPPGVYKVSNSINMSQRQGVHLVGAGQKATEIRATSNNPVIKYTGNVTTVTNASGVRSMTIRGYDNAQTNSYGIKSSWTNSCNIQDLIIFGCYAGLYFEHVWQTNVSNVRMYGSTVDACTYGVYMAESGTPIDNAIIAHNINVQNCLQTGFRIINGQGSKFVSCEAGGDPMVHAWHIGEPTTGTIRSQWIHFANCLGDSTTSSVWLFRKGTASELSQMQLSNCWAGNGQDGFYLDNVKQLLFNGCQSIGHAQSGFVVSSSEQVVINGCMFSGNDEAGTSSYADILIDSSTYNIISSNNCYTSMLTDSLIEKNSSNYNNIHGNYFSTGATLTGNKTIAFRNVGFLTETLSEATILNGTTSITVTHGLGVTPQLASINVTPRSGLGSASQFYISDVTSTTFKINVNTNPGTDISFCWNIALSTIWI